MQVLAGLGTDTTAASGPQKPGRLPLTVWTVWTVCKKIAKWEMLPDKILSTKQGDQRSLHLGRNTFTALRQAFCLNLIHKEFISGQVIPAGEVIIDPGLLIFAAAIRLSIVFFVLFLIFWAHRSGGRCLIFTFDFLLILLVGVFFLAVVTLSSAEFPLARQPTGLLHTVSA